jgi:hypothetical protein
MRAIVSVSRWTLLHEVSYTLRIYQKFIVSVYT